MDSAQDRRRPVYLLNRKADLLLFLLLLALMLAMSPRLAVYWKPPSPSRITPPNAMKTTNESTAADAGPRLAP